ncbi:hypothetical protein CsSME_00033842 [Camellia sinensis var. sinensis]
MLQYQYFTSFLNSFFIRYEGMRQCERIRCLKERKLFKGTAKATRKLRELNNVLDDKDHFHILWWKERMQLCRKPSSMQLIKRLMYTNLLGLDVNLKNGSRGGHIGGCI